MCDLGCDYSSLWLPLNPFELTPVCCTRTVVLQMVLGMEVMGTSFTALSHRNIKHSYERNTMLWIRPQSEVGLEGVGHRQSANMQQSV